MSMTQKKTAADLTPQQVVEAFVKAWEGGFIPAFERWMHPDALWQNTGFPDAVGKTQVMALLDRYLRVSRMPYGRVELKGVAAAGDLVLTERIDHLWSDDGLTHSAKIMGAFEVKDGLIARYSDYFDPTPFFDEKGH
jgi:limonene-1,2-epoxide hydrolase